MAVHAGQEGTAKVGANTISELRAWQFTETAETSDTSTLGTTARTHIKTVTTWEGSFTTNWDETDATGQGAMSIGASLTLNMYPEGSAGSSTFYTGTATITGIDRNADNDSVVNATYSFQGDGALTESTV